MIVLFISYLKVKNPELLEKKQEDQPSEIPKTFWIYCVFSFFTTIGFINFAIVGYHLKSNELFSDAKIPLLYTFAMIVDAIFGIIVGRIYDKIKLKFKNENSGLLVLIFIPVITALILPFVFSKNFLAIATGMFLWGIVMGSHETIMKSAIADLTSIKKRGTAYGIFNTIYGLALFFGTALSGFLYEISISVMIFTLMCLQVFAVMVFLRLKNEIQTGISSGS
jgi:predicted MFS family arabinose efflux permease